MEVLHRQQVGLPTLKPAISGRCLALRAMSVATRVVGDLDLCALLTAQHVSTERRAAASLDGRHHLELKAIEVSRPGLTPSRAAGAEDIRNLQR